MALRRFAPDAFAEAAGPPAGGLRPLPFPHLTRPRPRRLFRPAPWARVALDFCLEDVA